MKSLGQRLSATVIGLTALGLAASSAFAAYPDRPITIIVPTAAGGGNDAFARIVGQKMSESLGQTVVVLNKAGAQGAIGTEFVARAAPDGYTLLLGYIATHGINPALQKLRYDPVADFKGVGRIANSPTLLVVSTSSKINSVKDLIEQGKRSGSTINYASAGLGTAPHVAAELFKLSTGAEMLHVPYKGSAPGIADTMAGVTQVMFPSLFGGFPAVQSGKVKALALAGDKRTPLMKDVPTLEELGVKGVSVPQWYAFFAPAKTDSAIIDRLNKSLETALKDKEVVAKLAEQGADVAYSTPAELDAFVKSEVERWKGVVKAAKITAE